MKQTTPALILSRVELSFVFATGLVPSDDLQQAKADMFSEGVFDLENAFVRALFPPDSDQQVQ